MSPIYNHKRVFDYSYLISFHFFLNIINFVGRRSCQLIVNHYDKFVFKPCLKDETKVYVTSISDFVLVLKICFQLVFFCNWIIDVHKFSA